MVGEQDYSDVFQTLPIPCVLLLPDAPFYTIVNVSDAYLKVTNTKRGDLEGRGFFEAFPTNLYHSDTNWQHIFDEVLRERRICKAPPQKYAFPTAGTPARLDIKYFEAVNTPVLNQQGDIQYIIRSMTDVTNTIHYEKFFEATQQTARIGSWEVNMPHRAVTWSEGLREIYEVGADYEPCFDVLKTFFPDPAAQQTFEDALLQATKDGTAFHLTLPMVTAKGNERWLSIVGKADLLKGTCIRIYGITQDVSDSKRLTDLDDLEKMVLEMSASRDIPLQHILSTYILGIEALYSGMYCSILGVKNNRLVSWVAPSLPESYIAAVHDLHIGDGVGSCGTAAYRKERVVVSDIATDPRWTEFREPALKHGLRACWSHPVIDSHGRVIAVLGIYFKQIKAPNPEEVVTIDRMSALLNVIIEKRHHIDAIKVQNERLQEIAWMQSHMVRAPLARIMGLVDLIQHAAPPDIDEAQLLRAIYDSAIELDDILGAISEKAEQVNLTDR